MKLLHGFAFLCVFSQALFATDLDLQKIRDPKTFLEKVRRGFDVDAVRSSDGYTLLHYAADVGSVELVLELLERGAIKNPVMHSGNTPLSTAIRSGHKDIVRIFLEQGVDPNFKLGKADKEKTHFHYYITQTQKLDRYIYDLFIKKGANVESKDSSGETPLMAIAGSGVEKLDHLKLLLSSRADAKAQNREGRTPLMLAVFSLDEAMVQFLISVKVPVNQRDFEGNTVLIGMIPTIEPNKDLEEKKLKILKLLINSGADLNATNNEGSTVLHELVKTNEYNLLSYVIDLKPDSSKRNQRKQTPLDMAIQKQNWKVTEMLLKIEKNLDALDETGFTRLHSAIQNDSIELLRLLLEAGANPDIQDREGRTAKDLALFLKNKKAIEILESGP
ncbi:hypothetical protein LPTSP4_32080 [Leptospira ryugenii]|uniref:Uncharacterized protein n=1 Tax=Leptospira ryugenii TaxID=1917863 RepID=A0A2P2E458_9LEPT|nr:ankyrin repeat domain-containing protein [Leptospira ryugenii]GBF51670.1 hypothetical protein LPTSP4_32080 [Leptospira ryugenii]